MVMMGIKQWMKRRKRIVFTVIVIGLLLPGAVFAVQKAKELAEKNNKARQGAEAGKEPEELSDVQTPKEGQEAEAVQAKVAKVQGVSYPKAKKEEDIDIFYKKNVKPFFKSTIQDTLTSREGKNRVYSPVNLYFCMAMLAEMADGQTKEQLLNALGQDSAEEVRKQSQLIWQKIYQDEKISKCILGNSVWLNQEVPFEKEVLKALSKYYYAESYQGQMGKGMDKKIQGWINKITGNRLKEEAGKIETEEDMLLVLLSAAHFYNQWEVPFPEDKTKKDTFTNVNGEKISCDFMNGVRIGGVNQKDSFRATSLEMENGAAMHLFLPEEWVTVEDLLRDNMDEILQILGSPSGYGAETGIVTVSLPKFSISSSLNLIPVLENIGITDIFKPGAADFTKLLGKGSYAAYVSKVWQAAKASVDEKGCSVDSFTEVEMKYSGIPEEREFTIKFDRPFLFIISNYTGIPIFAGVINQLEGE